MGRRPVGRHGHGGRLRYRHARGARRQTTDLEPVDPEDLQALRTPYERYTALEEIAQQHARQVIWMTPESKWGRPLGSCDMPLYEPICNRVEVVHTVDHLAGVAEELVRIRSQWTARRKGTPSPPPIPTGSAGPTERGSKSRARAEASGVPMWPLLVPLLGARGRDRDRA